MARGTKKQVQCVCGRQSVLAPKIKEHGYPFRLISSSARAFIQEGNAKVLRAQEGTLKRSGRLSRGKQWSHAHRGLSSILQNEQHPRHRVALNLYSAH